jgi:hypothetical protein
MVKTTVTCDKCQAVIPSDSKTQLRLMTNVQGQTKITLPYPRTTNACSPKCGAGILTDTAAAVSASK